MASPTPLETVEYLIEEAVNVESVAQLEHLAPDSDAIRVRRLDDEIAAGLCRVRGLRAVMHSGSSTISDAGVRALATIPTLQALDLEWSSNITDDALVALEGVTSLRWLDVSFCSQLTSVGIERFASARPECEIERIASGQ